MRINDKATSIAKGQNMIKMGFKVFYMRETTVNFRERPPFCFLTLVFIHQNGISKF